MKPNRIAVVALFNESKIKAYFKDLNITLCKVPFKEQFENRFLIDTMPYHLTLTSGDIKEKNEVIKELDNQKFGEIKITINKLDILPGKNNSYVLVFNGLSNEKLNLIQHKIYNILKNSKYEPDLFKYHITIHISNNYEEILTIKKHIEKCFKPFTLKINKISLYKIWPPILEKEYLCIKNI